MARLASLSKAGYFPIPKHLIPTVAAVVDLDWSVIPSSYGGSQPIHSVLDPCAGEGEALFTLAKAWAPERNLNLQVFGCELEATRIAKLKARARTYDSSMYRTHVEQGDAFTLDLRVDDHYPGVSVLYLNPPYDTDKEHGRLEERWLARFTPFLRAGGILIFVVPYYALKASAATLGKFYEEIQVGQFPAADFEGFKQVVLFARRREADLLYADAAVETAVLANAQSVETLIPLACVRPYKVAAQAKGVFSRPYRTQAADPVEISRQYKPWHATVKKELLPMAKVLPDGPWLDLSLRTFPLACPPRASYIAAGIASGVFNGARIEPDDPASGLPPLYIKGTFKREFHDVDVQKNDKGEVTKQVQVQHPELTVTVLDARKCDGYVDLKSSIEVNPAETEVEKFTVGDLFARYSKALMRVLRTRCPILHDPSNPDHATPLPTFPRNLFRAQREAVRTAVKLLQGPDRAAMILGQIGSGKSTVALATAQTFEAKSVLILCPPHLLQSWADQVTFVIPWARVVTLEKPADLAALADDPTPGMRVALLSREAAKLGHAYESVWQEKYLAAQTEISALTVGTSEHTAAVARFHGMWRCPQCQRSIDPKWTPDVVTGKRKKCAACVVRYKNTEARLTRRLAWELAMRFPGSTIVGQLLDAPAINTLRVARARHEDMVVTIDSSAIATITGELVALMERTSYRHTWEWGGAQSTALYHLCAFLAGDTADTYDHTIFDAAQRLALASKRYGKRRNGTEYQPSDEDYEKRPKDGGSVASLVWRLVAMLPPAEIDRFLAWADGGASAIPEPDPRPSYEIMQETGMTWGQVWAQEEEAKKQYNRQVAALQRFPPPEHEAAMAIEQLAGREPEKKHWRDPLLSLSIKETEDKGRLRALGWQEDLLSFNGLALGDPLHVHHAMTALQRVAVIDTTQVCGAPLYQAVPRPRRYPLAKLITKRYRDLFDFLVVDEGHEYSNETSAQSQAAQRLFGLKLPTLMLTGSVMNGYASSLFVPCWSLSTRFRDEFGRGDVNAYVDRYGYLKRTITFSSSGKADVSYGKVSDRQEKKQVAQAPGVMPISLLRHVLPVAVTLQLEDLEAELPEKVEIVREVEAAPEVRARYARARDKLIDCIKRDRFTNKAGKLFGQLSELPSYLDRATADTGNRLEGNYVVQYPADVGGEVLCDFAGFDPLVMLPKERELCAIIKSELAEGRRVMVFPWHVELMPRLKKLIEAQCACKVAILESDKVQAKKREVWINKHVVNANVDVLLVNPVAVQTGLNNLVHFCSVVWYENPGCNPQIRRQAQGRIYRIGQTKPVRIYTLYYGGTAQQLLHELLLYKVGISEAVDGLDPKGSLQAAGVGEVSELSGQSVGAVLYKMLCRELGLPD